jgi:molybdenum cofactor cytidylyltransferase
MTGHYNGRQRTFFLKIIAILLAAGAGSRFGGDKLLHPWCGGVAIGAHAARHLIAAGLEVVAVVKPGDARLTALLEGEGCRVTVCEHAARGMGASLAHGIAAGGYADGWVIALADMPLILSATITAVVRALEEGNDIVAPVFQGQRGHPVGLSRHFSRELLALDGDAGARDIIAANKSRVRLLDCDDPGILHDIDRKTDVTG